MATEITRPHSRHLKHGVLGKASIWRRYGFAWVTAAFFIISLVGHWLFGWFAYVGEQVADGHAPEFGQYILEMGRDTLENWQSEFLQLIWQVAGLTLLLYVGSPQSPEGDHRLEEKLDAILRLVDAKQADAIIREIDTRYDRED
jgi:hypothetical protein